MGKVLAYLRTSTDKQDLSHQKFEILGCAQKNGFQIDDFLSSISFQKSRCERCIDESLEKVETVDTLIVSELSRLSGVPAKSLALVSTPENSAEMKPQN